MASNAERARSFGADATRYDRARPTYAAEMVEFLLEDQPGTVLDVGCGTGIASRPFQEAGCVVRGVEHDDRMAEVARDRGLRVDVGTFEDWEPGDGSLFDLLISGQAWHWIHPIAGPAKAAQVLRPGGRLAIVWVTYEHSDAVAEVFGSVYARHAEDLLAESFPLGGQPERTEELSSSYVSAIDADGSFMTPVTRTFPGKRSYTVEGWLDELPTHSDHRLLPATKRDELLRSLRDALLSTVGSDFTVGLATHRVTALRRR